jgi:hypothetical protein
MESGIGPFETCCRPPRMSVRGVNRKSSAHLQNDAFDPKQTSDTLFAQENPARRNPSRYISTWGD